MEVFNFIESGWKILNYFFGTINYRNYRVEIEAVDIFVFMGVIRFVTFCYLIYLVFLKGGGSLSKYFLITVLL